jgi:hypothetical protein
VGNKGGGFFPPRWLARVRKIAYIYTAHVVAAAASGVDAWRVLAFPGVSTSGSTTWRDWRVELAWFLGPRRPPAGASSMAKGVLPVSKAGATSVAWPRCWKRFPGAVRGHPARNNRWMSMRLGVTRHSNCAALRATQCKRGAVLNTVFTPVDAQLAKRRASSPPLQGGHPPAIQPT